MASSVSGPRIECGLAEVQRRRKQNVYYLKRICLAYWDLSLSYATHDSHGRYGNTSIKNAKYGKNRPSAIVLHELYNFRFYN